MENKQSAEQTEHFGIGRTKWRITILVIFLFLALLGSFLSLTKGSSIISIKEITDILLNPGNDPRSQIIWNIRMPRTIVGALVGINLSLSGAILQAIMRNPLADPHIIGISSGAGLAGVVIMILFPAMEYLITPVAFIGAMLAAVCIYILAWKNGIKPVRIILAGVGENQWSTREEACEGLEFIGVKIDKELNKGLRGVEKVISTADSKVTVCIIPTDEELMIATDTMNLL